MRKDNSNWPRFRLSTLLLLLTCFALFSGWLADSIRNSRTIDRNEQEHQAEVLNLNKEYRAEVLNLSRQIGKFRNAADVVKSLQVQSFHRQPILEDQIRFMARFPELRKLDLSGADVSPQKLKLISDLDQLESLNLAHNPQLTDESLSCLRNMPRLRELELTACKAITVAGLRELEQIPSLERVRLDPKHRVAAADLVRALPNCVVVFENANKLESFGILATFRDTRGVFGNTVRKEIPDSLDPTNRRRFGVLRRPARRRQQSVAAKTDSNIGDAVALSHFSQALDAFIADPRDEAACKCMLEASSNTARRALHEASVRKHAYYLLARLNQDRENVDLSEELYQLPFSVMVNVAKTTFWPHPLPRIRGRKVYFESCEKIEGTTVINVLSFMAPGRERNIDGLSLIHKRMFVFAVERPNFEYAKSFYGDIGRYVYKPNSVQRYDSRGCSEKNPTGMELPMIELSKEQAIEWIQNGNPTPIWSVKYLPELGPNGKEYLLP